jgi:hypothetical protein
MANGVRINAAISTGLSIEPSRDRRAIQVVLGGTIARRTRVNEL